jgi:alditol oxidase
MTTAPLTNWAGNVVFSTRDVRRPTSIHELQQIVSDSPTVRALGTGHSFNEIADTTGTLVTVAGLPRRLDIDRDARTVTVSAGTRYGELGGVLHQAGFGIPNTGSLPHISIAGASATGTHGSGNTLGNLATIVSRIEMVTATGDLVTTSRATDPDTFGGMVLALGTLGIVTALTLEVVPTFHIRQDVYDDLPQDVFLEHFDEIMAGAYSVSAFSTWQNPRRQQVWMKSAVEPDDASAAAATLHGAPLATVQRHPLAGMPPENTTAQLGVPGPWFERLPHFRLDFTPSSGDEIQSEFLLPRRHAAAALTALDDIAADVAAVLQVAEIRTTAADSLWLSPSYGTDTVCLHYTWIGDERAITPVVAAVEERLAPFDARPHWGKRFTVAPTELARLYPRLPDFRSLAERMDPAGKFRNELVGRLLFGDFG